MKRVEKVTVPDLKSITAGNEKIFHLDHPSKLQNVRSLATQTWKNYPELGVRFRCKIDYANITIAVRAEECLMPQFSDYEKEKN
ncbi:MAG: hypothetical protein QM653_03630 [Dysgonomonas sp.]|uniref:hypothetical protein n=1 Tax=Dysgonomonas sp. TaxID=1891233 RepID=UPI0039E2AF77